MAFFDMLLHVCVHFQHELFTIHRASTNPIDGSVNALRDCIPTPKDCLHYMNGSLCYHKDVIHYF